jgi:hypothetical protein
MVSSTAEEDNIFSTAEIHLLANVSSTIWISYSNEIRCEGHEVKEVNLNDYLGTEIFSNGGLSRFCSHSYAAFSHPSV